MPQGPLHGLKSATPDQGKPLFKESKGWGIQADPAAQEMTDFRKAHPWISGAADFFTGGATDPSFESGPLDVLGAGIPFAHGLPGMYSRLGRAVSKLPEAMKSNSALNALRKLAHPEEIEFRGLGEMLTKRGARPVERGEIESHLAANPIDLKIKELTSSRARPSGAWENGPLGYGQPNPTLWDSYQMPGATNYGETLIGLPMTADQEAQAGMKRAGYHPDEMADVPSAAGPPAYQSAHYANDPNTLVYTRHNERTLPHPTGKWEPEHFTAKPWGESSFDPHTDTEISRTDLMDRRTDPWVVTDIANPSNAMAGYGNTAEEAIQDVVSTRNVPGQGYSPPPGPRGRVIENIQSDWHQEGAKSGYAGRIVDPTEKAAMERFKALGEEDADLYRQISDLRIAHEPTPNNEDGLIYTMYDQPFHPDFNREANDRFRAATDSLQQRRDAVEAEKFNLLTQFPDMTFQGEVPNAPFKDKRWADLALKQQVLDVANRPDLEWLGIAPGSESVKRGESLSPVFHDETLPNKLGKILAPFGGKMEQVSTPSGKWTEPNFRNYYNPTVGTHLIYDTNTTMFPGEIGGEHLASVWPKTEAPTYFSPEGHYLEGFHSPNLRANELQRLMEHERTLPIDIKIWLARMSPEMKADILKKGLPLLSLYAMMQSQQQPVEGLRATPIQ